MKKVIVFVLLVCSWSARAQNFEGTIRWSMKMEITDPAMKAKMEEGMKKMSDPANQAKIKELQAKMEEPEMKAMLDANPQMKTMMENQLKMMTSGGDMSSMMPKGIVMQMKNNNALTKMEGGPIQMEVLYLKDKDMSYHIDRQNKTYSVLSTTKPKSSTTTPPKVTKTSETTTILGYKATKYLVDITENGRTMKQSVWTTTDLKDIDVKSLYKQRVGSSQSILYEGMEGFPLKSEISMPEGSMVMEVTEIKKGSVSSSDFVIPAGFKETQGMFK